MTLKADTLHELADKGLTLLYPLEGRDGYIFVLATTSPTSKDAQIVFDLLKDHAERLTQSFGGSANAQHRFEQFLSALNEALSGGVLRGDWTIPIETFSALVGIAVDEEMYLSGTGELTGLFLHRKPSQRYQIYNLFRSIQTEQALPTWEKPFAVVLDGQLHPGDVFCVASKEITREIPQEDLHAILSTLPPSSAIAKIRQYYPGNAELALFILKGADAAPSEVTHAPIERTEVETQRVLEDQAPQIPILAKQKPSRKRRKTSSRGFKSVWRLFQSVFTVAWHLLLGLGQWMAQIARLFVKKDERALQFALWKERATDHKRAAISSWSKISPRTKLFVAGGIIFLLLFVLSVRVISTTKATRAELQAYTESVSEIETLLDQAQGAIIYKDENQARTLYANITEKVGSLDVSTDARQQTSQGFLEQIALAQNELRRLSIIETPPVLADLSSVSSGLTATAMTQINGELLLTGSDNALYRLEPTTQQFLRVNEALESTVAFSQLAGEDTDLAGLDDRVGVSRIDRIDGTVTQTTALAPANTSWVDLALFNSGIYVLEPSLGAGSGQIIRFRNIDLSRRDDWITERTSNFQDAVSLTIDGSIYVLRKDGVILRFTSGTEDRWSHDTFDPPLEQPTDIWTNEESTRLYVLDPPTGRIIVLEKETGALLRQFQSDSFKGATGMVIDESTNALSILVGSTLYSISTSGLSG